MGSEDLFVKGIVTVFGDKDAVLEKAYKRHFASSHRKEYVWRKMQSIEAGISSPGFFPEIWDKQRVLLGVCGNDQKYNMNSGRVGAVPRNHGRDLCRAVLAILAKWTEKKHGLASFVESVLLGDRSPKFLGKGMSASLRTVPEGCGTHCKNGHGSSHGDGCGCYPAHKRPALQPRTPPQGQKQPKHCILYQ